MTWTGEVRRDLTGELRHAAGDVIPLRGEHRDGVIYIEGDGLLSWRGDARSLKRDLKSTTYPMKALG